ncbi:MAG: fatty acid desaturase [Gammaproteobacteria bacterium]|nr:fatty acid desaturase [Gammaproteobacteria bacterium]
MELLMTILQGQVQLPVWGYVLTALGLTHITIIAVTVFLHRHQSHNSLSLNPVLSHFFRFWLWLTTGIVTKQWVAVHRKHHAKCETEEDPHSPQIMGIRRVLWQGREVYREATSQQSTMDKYGNGTPDDWLERKIYGRIPLAGILTMLLIDLVLFGAIGLTIFAIQMVWIPFWAAGVINGIGHYWGYRNYETEDASRNIIPWGIIVGGEELHNNHHAHASSARLSSKWWELDIGWFYIRLFSIFKLVKINKVSPRVELDMNKQLVDMETVRAVVRNRFHIMSLYGQKVVKPVLHEECLRANEKLRDMYQKVSRFLTREDIQPESKQKKLIEEILAQNERLETVYRLKQQLKMLWQNSSTQQNRRIQRLQAWCQEAEQTGIVALQEFAEYLKGYTLKSAI